MVSLETGSARQVISSDRAAALLEVGTLIVDNRRRRPRYFDGRFLTAGDLTRDQTYFLTRQADLCRAGGVGVVQGLMVQRLEGVPDSIQVTAGQGVTPTGELVVLNTDRIIPLNNIVEIQRLDAALGLLPLPQDPALLRSGLYIVALRPVEFSANPIASYPTSITGPRTVQDGDIVEAVAITLIPYPMQSEAEDLDRQRSQVAWEIFVQGAIRGIRADALPLAIIALEGNIVLWVDPYLVRREVGTEYDDLLKLEATPRSLREAHFLQYSQQFDEILKQRGPQRQRFTATQYFQALPPVGQMPTAAIDPNTFSQSYFPAEVDIELAFVPSDEIAALLDETLILPPIDLTLSDQDLDSTSILVLIPVHRQRLQQLRGTLDQLSRPLRPPAPGLAAKRRPIDTLRTLPSLTTLRLPILPTQLAADPQKLIDDQWRQALQGSDRLWYVRRRNLPYRQDAGVVNTQGLKNEFPTNIAMFKKMAEWNLEKRFYQLVHWGSWQFNGELVDLLASPKFAISKLLMEAVLYELEVRHNELAALSRQPDAALQQQLHPNEQLLAGEAGGPRLTRFNARQVSEKFGDPYLGEGIHALERANPDLTQPLIVMRLTQSRSVPQLDRLGRLMPAESLPTFAQRLEALARLTTPDIPGGIKQLIDDELKRIEEVSP
jgi:hypothetical protein